VIVREDDETVRRWLKRYLDMGIEGLQDRPRPGAAPKITKEFEEQLLEAVRHRPRSLGQPYSMWTLQRLATYLAAQTGIQVSDEPIRRLLLTHEIVFSRPQHTISSPDPEYTLKKLGWQAYLDEREILGKEERRIGKRGFHDGRRRCRVV
jgi:transposase